MLWRLFPGGNTMRPVAGSVSGVGSALERLRRVQRGAGGAARQSRPTKG